MRGMATPEVIAWKPLGELLVERGLLTPGELDDALDEQARTGERLGAILVARKTVAGAVLTALLAEQAGVELETQGGFGSGLFSKLARQERSGSQASNAAARPTHGSGSRQAASDGEAAAAAQSDPAYELSALRAEVELLRVRNEQLEAELAALAPKRAEAKPRSRRPSTA
jgi:hypothetical protein